MWFEISASDFGHRAALFLDRDGVIVEDTNYLGRPEDMRVLPGAAEAIARCNRLRIPIVMVSNQSGIARGLYDWSGFHAVQAALAVVLANAGAHLDPAFACAHHAEGGAPLNIPDHPWRKPNPGMIVAAAQQMNLDLSHSWIVGNRVSDIAAGRAAQLAGGILLSPREDDPEQDEAIGSLRAAGYAVEISASLADAVSLLFSRGHLGPAVVQAEETSGQLPHLAAGRNADLPR